MNLQGETSQLKQGLQLQEIFTIGKMDHHKYTEKISKETTQNDSYIYEWASYPNNFLGMNVLVLNMIVKTEKEK